MSQQPVESHWDLKWLEHVSNLRLEQVTSCSTCHFCGKISHHMTPGNLWCWRMWANFYHSSAGIAWIISTRPVLCFWTHLPPAHPLCLRLSMGTKLALRPRTQKNATDTGVNWFSTGFLMFSQLVSTKIWRERVFLLLVAPGFTFFEVFQLSYCWTLIWFNCTCGTLILSH